ncbi:MAG: hypothetical protein ACOYO2_01175 [Mycobacterium sp.]
MIRPHNPNPEFVLGLPLIKSLDLAATPKTSADRRPRHVVAH